MKNTFTLLLLLITFTQSSAQVGLDFDGTDDFIQTNITGITGNQSRTFEAWIKTSVNGSQDVIIGTGTMPLGTRFTMNVLNGLLRIEIGGGGINSQSFVADNQWHHVAVTYDPSALTDQFKIYIDGNFDIGGNITAATVNTAAGTGLIIGRRNDGVNYFEGQMDEVRIWSVVRTQAEIQGAMNTELCNASGLVGYYRFDEGIAGNNNTAINSIIDYSGNLNNGSLSGFTQNGSASNWVTGVNITPATGSTSATVAITSCGSYTLPSGNATYSTSGTYADTISTVSGCDSILTINLTISNNTSSTTAITACNSYAAPNGDSYTSSQIINYTIPNAAGCDSLISIDLTIVNTTSSIVETACFSFIAPSGTIYNSSQIITDIIPSYFGCDSIITINLTVNTVDPTVTYLNDTALTATEDGAVYQWYDCIIMNPPALIAGATSQVLKPTVSGEYAVEITKNGCTILSSCYYFDVLSTKNQIFQSNISIAPNPTNDNFRIDFSEHYKDVEILIYSIDGQLIKNLNIENQIQVNINLDNNPAGLYQIKLISDDRIANFKLVKL